MVLCAVVGGIYMYIYFTRINPPGKARKYAAPSGDGAGGSDDSGSTGAGATGAGGGTHLFLFRKS